MVACAALVALVLLPLLVGLAHAQAPQGVPQAPQVRRAHLW